MVKDVEQFFVSQTFGFPFLRILFRYELQFCLDVFSCSSAYMDYSIMKVIKDSWGPGLFKFFIYLDIGILLDVELIKNIFHSIGYYSFFQMTVSSALQRPFSFMRSHLLIIDLRAYANSIMFRKVFLFVCLFLCQWLQGYSPLSLPSGQCIWFYIEIFDPFGAEFV